MDILDDMRVSKLSVKVFFKVNYSFKSNSNCNYPFLQLHLNCQITFRI